AADPTNPGWQRDLAVAYQDLGDVAVRAGKLEEARARFEKALTSLTALTSAGSASAGWKSDLATSYNELGDLALRSGKLDDAREWFD
ncbi:MAG: tetratricopeptide repeat protein, partial [Deltaproteobacteria bacterium]